MSFVALGSLRNEEQSAGRLSRTGVGAPTILPIPVPPGVRAVVLAGSDTAAIPGFLVVQPAGGFWESLRIACSRSVSGLAIAGQPFEKTFLKRSEAVGNSFGLALVFHALALAGVLYLPQYLPADSPGPVAYAAEQPEVLYYYRMPPVVRLEKQVPQIAPPGQAGRPGEGVRAEETPTKGSTATLGDLTVISKPLQPDNHHQTIIQPQSPPDMRITEDIKLPNMIIGNLSAPQAPLTFSARDMPKPVQTDRQIAAANAPSIADPTRGNGLPVAGNEPVVAKPQLPIEPLKPNQLARGNSGPSSSSAPNVADSARSSLAFSAGDPAIAKPQLPMGMQKPVQQARGNSGQTSTAAAPNLTDSTRSDPTALMATNEPIVAKPALPIAMQRPQVRGGGQGAPGVQGGAPAAPTVAEATSGAQLSNFGGSGSGPTAPLQQMTAMQKPNQPGRGGNGQGSQAGQGGLAAVPSVAEPARGAGTPNFSGTGGNGPAVPLPQVPGLQRPVQQARAGSGATGGQGSQQADGAPTLSDAKGLMVIGVDPSPAGSQIVVPPGNRWGDFTIAPASGAGSPGGAAVGGSTAAGTTGQRGSGGDRSVGVGPGGTGGGGGSTSVSFGPISVKGTLPATSGEPLILTGSVAAQMVYPLPISVVSKLRPNRMVVSAGSIGGGGLNVYGALACGKIYTIFLPMPGSSWTMQYCQKSTEAAPEKAQTQTKVIQLAAPLVPPDPNEDGRFDFKRLPVPAGTTQNKMIVLKGTLNEEGNVENLQVYQGVLPEMDQAAQLAFGRWKFKPAVQSNKPVSVEILVGIPAQLAPAAADSASQPTSSR